MLRLIGNSVGGHLMYGRTSLEKVAFHGDLNLVSAVLFSKAVYSSVSYA